MKNLKKIFTLVGSLTIAATAGIATIACSHNKENTKENKAKPATENPVKFDLASLPDNLYVAKKQYSVQEFQNEILTQINVQTFLDNDFNAIITSQDIDFIYSHDHKVSEMSAKNLQKDFEKRNFVLVVVKNKTNSDKVEGVKNLVVSFREGINKL